MSKWLAILVLLGCIGVVGWEGVGELDDLGGRLRSLETRALTSSRTSAALEDEVLCLTSELETVRGQLTDRERELETLRVMAERVVATEDQLEVIAGSIEDQQLSLARLETERSKQTGDVLEAHFATLDQELRERFDNAFELASNAVEIAGESRQGLELLAESIRRRNDYDAMWRQLVGPVVQLSGEDSVGSGVLLSPRSEQGVWRTYVLTAWHVVRDIQGSLDHQDMPVPVTVYLEDGSTRAESARLLEFNPQIDVALLLLDSEERLPYGAELPTRAEFAEVRVFDPVYAVGCPLGNSPIPTAGEVAARHHVVEGSVYVLINAPTYVGNSGGGIFEADTRELLGIFSKVYTHGTVRPTIVTHMGLITPMDVVYDWLDAVGYGSLEPGRATEPGPAATAAR